MASGRQNALFAYDAAVFTSASPKKDLPTRRISTAFIGAGFVALTLCACSTNTDSKPTAQPAATSAAPAAATATVSPAAAEIAFDPRNPPPGWRMCHRNHCHHEDGHVGSYAQVMKEMGATKIVGQPTPKAAPPAPSDVGNVPTEGVEKSASGLVSRVVKPGAGTKNPHAGSVVTVHYTGWTPDGKSFDSSIVRDQPARFPLNKVFPGWTEGIQMMVIGEERRFWIPQELAFNGAPGKPTGTLVFDVELIAIAP